MIITLSTYILATDIHLLPSELETRISPYSNILIGYLFIGFCLIANASLLRAKLFASLIKGNWITHGVKGFVRESYPYIKLSGNLLLLNFVLTSTMFSFLALNIEMSELLEVKSVLYILPIIVLAWEILAMLIVGLLSGRFDVFHEIFIIRIMGAQFLGVLLWVCVLAYWIFPKSGDVIIIGGIVIILAEMLIRFLRSIINVYGLGGSGYYIILYFCTLEILPLFVATYLLMVN